MAITKHVALAGLLCILGGCSAVFPQDGEVALRQGHLDEAARQVSDALAEDPGNLQLKELAAEIFTRRGARYYDQRQMIAAANDFDTAIKYDPMYAPAYDYLGMVAFWNHNWERAIEYGDHASELQARPDPPYVLQAKQELEKVKNGGSLPVARKQPAKPSASAEGSN